MNNLKLNKLAENKLNEKEMNVLTGGVGITTYVYCTAQRWGYGSACGTTCSCTFHPPYVDPSSSNGQSSAGSSMDSK